MYQYNLSKHTHTRTDTHTHTHTHTYIYATARCVNQTKQDLSEETSIRQHIEFFWGKNVHINGIQFNPYPANVENRSELLAMSANGRWDLTRRLKC